MIENFYRQQPDYEGIRRTVYRIKAESPLARVFPIGRSVLGRGLFAVSIGGTKGATVFTGGLHGAQWMTTLLLFRFCEDVLKAMEHKSQLAGVDIARAFENRPLVIIPCMNPDGMEIAAHGPQTAGVMAERVKAIYSKKRLWQANARGIDLSHNFDAGWQTLRQMEQKLRILGPSPSKYGGPRPGSEPETRALTGFCTGAQIRQVYDFQMQGQVIHSSYGQHTPVRSQLMAQVLASSCGYRVCPPKGTAAHGSFARWFVDKLHRPGFTVRVGKGQMPLPVAELEPLYNQLVEMMILAAIL